MKELDILVDQPTQTKRELVFGVFPGHVVDLEEGRKNGNSIPFNFTILIAEEAKDIVGKDAFTGEDKSGAPMVGRKIRSSGVWLDLKPTESWRNNKYILVAENMGIEFPKTDDGKVKLLKLEKEDVLGLPVMVQIGWEFHRDDRNKPFDERRKYVRALKFFKWENGKRIEVKDKTSDILEDLGL